MRSPGWPQLLQWRRFAVDVLVAAATLAVTTAALAAPDPVGVLVLSGALVGLAMLIEPGAAGNPPTGHAAVRPWWRVRAT